MREFNRRPTRNHVLLGFFVRAVGALVLLFIAIISVKGTWSMYERFSQAMEGANATKNELATLKNQETQVGAAVSSLSNERGVEAQIRDRYGVAKPGEGEILVVRDSTSSETATSDSQENLLLRILHGLFVW